MANFDIAKAQASNLTSLVTDYSIDTLNTDAATGQKETEWQNTKWTQQWGYFNNVPDLKNAIIMKAIWNVGKGYTCDAETKVILDHITGWGKDTFKDILFNAEVIASVGGDFFAEIIRDEETDILLNLKPLDPGNIKIIVDENGIIKRYEQHSKIPSSAPRKFKPKEIFHYCNNRFADQIHGISDIDVLEKTILAEEESFDDAKKLMHRQAKPMIMFKIGTNDSAKIAAFVEKMDKATAKGENIYIPDDENTVSFEIVQVDISNQFLLWRTDVRNKFYRALGLPLAVFSSGGSTESGGKIEFYGHEAVWEHRQRNLENQLLQQLGVRVDLYPPSTLQENLQGDETKDAGQQLAFQQSEVKI